MTVFMRRCALALALAGMLAPRAGAASDADVPASVRTAVGSLDDAQRRGTVGYHRHLVTDQRAPGRNQHVEVETGRIRHDGHIVAVKIYRRTVDGVAVSAEEIAKLQAELDKHPPDDDYRLPVKRDLLEEYRFGAPVACPACAEGLVALPFTSLKRDDNHGDGTIVVDTRAGHVVRLEFKPSVTPKQTDSGKIVMTFGSAGADAWDVLSSKQHYAGHAAFITWTFEKTATHSGHRRFETLDEARTALAAGL